MHMLESMKFHFPQGNYKFHFREVTSPTDYRADLLPWLLRGKAEVERKDSTLPSP